MVKKTHLRARSPAIKLKTARGRTVSSQRWLQRQLNDPYVIEARQRGYRSRAAFKLLALDERYHFLKGGKTVLDLGAAPGGWTQVCMERVKPDSTGGRVISLDRAEMDPILGATILRLDFMADTAEAAVREALSGRIVNIVLSDMAPSSSGHPQTDHLRIMALIEAAYAFAESVLAPGGAFIAKILQGGEEKDLSAKLRKRFDKVALSKPEASRKDSAEMYIVALGFHP